jgi:hypothetical protein
MNRRRTDAGDGRGDVGEGWSFAEYRRLRAGSSELAELLEGRSLEPVLQRAGTALLGGLDSGSADLTELARRCATGLRQRGWAGDELLADELERAVGNESGKGELAPTPVDLEDLAEALDSDPADGEGAFDPLTGEVLPGVVLNFDGLEADEIDEAAEERRIGIWPGSGEAYGDMAEFTETVTDPGLRDRLLRALDGRGAFRRFKNTIHDADGEPLTAWTIFAEERGLGRAREWLAECGYRPQVRKGWKS